MFKQSTAFKGIAIFLVILNHTTVMGGAGLARLQINPSDQLSIILKILAAFGYYAVPIFLFFSGCYLSYALEKRNLTNSYKIILTNIKVVLWPYLIWSCLFYLLIYFDGGQTFTIGGYIKNIIVGYPYNFVPILIFFYLISPLLKRVQGVSVGIVLFICLLYQIFLILILDPELSGAFPDFLRGFAPPVLRDPMRTWLIYFPLGLFIKTFLVISKKAQHYLKYALIPISLLTLVLHILDVVNVLKSPWFVYILPLPMCLLLIYWERDKIPFVKFFERLGKKSYGLYLVNLISLDLLSIGLNLFVESNSLFIPIYYLLLFAFTVLVPLLFLEWFESRNKKIFRYFFG